MQPLAARRPYYTDKSRYTIRLDRWRWRYEIFLCHFWIIAAGTIVGPTQAQVNVTQEHNHISRDGLYVDSAFTQTAAANLRRDLNFNGTTSGSIYAQPLDVEDGPGGAAMIIVATETNRDMRSMRARAT